MHSENQTEISQLEKAKQELTIAVNSSISAIEKDINSTRELYEKMKNYGDNRFDNLMNLCLYSSVTNADLFLLVERIRLANRRLEKLLFARMLAIVAIEYLKDINELLGYKLIGELNKNHFNEFVPTIKILNGGFADIRKEHEKFLIPIRNNISAHKTKDALELVNDIFKLDPNRICELSLEIINVNHTLTIETTKIYNKIIENSNPV